MSRFTTVCARLALSVERGRLPESEAFQAAVWCWRYSTPLTEWARDNEPAHETLAADLNTVRHLFTAWRLRARNAMSHAEAAVERALKPLLAARAPSVELLATARRAADTASVHPLLTEHEITRLVERELCRHAARTKGRQ